MLVMELRGDDRHNYSSGWGVLTPHHSQQVLSIFSAILTLHRPDQQGERIFQSAVCMQCKPGEDCRIFLICLCSAQLEMRKMIKILWKWIGEALCRSQRENAFYQPFSLLNNSRSTVVSSQSPAPRQAWLWLAERSWAGVWLVYSQALVSLSQLCQGLELLTNSRIVSTICYEASDWRFAGQGGRLSGRNLRGKVQYNCDDLSSWLRVLLHHTHVRGEVRLISLTTSERPPPSQERLQVSTRLTCLSSVQRICQSLS